MHGGVPLLLVAMMGWLCQLYVSAVALAAIVLGPSIVSAALSSDRKASQAKDMGEGRSVQAVIGKRIKVILDQAESDNDYTKASHAASVLFDKVLAWAPVKDTRSFVEVAYARRLLRQLRMARFSDTTAMLRYLRRNQKLARTLAFFVHPFESPAEIYRLVDRLRIERGDKLDQYANLVTAICCVHDQSLVRRVNENQVQAADPVELFDYFVRYRKKMYYGVVNMPPELLVFVVDSTATIGQMQWALQRYEGDGNIGDRFFEIKYDRNHFRYGSAKRVTLEGFNLPNILKYGGVCADQAYFAASVGKAIGVPAAYTYGRSGQLSHAWVGFFVARNKQGFWNFDVGRYNAYRGVQGITENPQTRQPIDDSTVALRAELVPSSVSDRHAAVAMTDAARRLAALLQDDRLLSSDPFGQDVSRIMDQSRTVDSDQCLKLLEAGLRRCVGFAPGWQVLAEMAEAEQLSLDQKIRWSGLLLKFCGHKYPDFAFDVLRPLIGTISDVDEQISTWDNAFKIFQHRSDLSASVLMAQGEAWEAAGRLKKAGECYRRVVQRYANAGPFVINALRNSERILVALGMTDRVITLYRSAWELVDKPKDAFYEFRKQSNWYRIGMLYVEKLNEAGEFRTAERAAARIDQVLGAS